MRLFFGTNIIEILAIFIFFMASIAHSQEININNQEMQASQELIWEAEINGDSLKIISNKFNLSYSQAKFPFNFIGKQNYEGFHKNQIYFIETNGNFNHVSDLKDRLTSISLDGNFFLGYKENEKLTNFYRYIYRREQNKEEEIIWDQPKIDKNIENVYLSPDGTFIIFTHGTSEQTTKYIQFINDKGDIYATHNFPARNVLFSPISNYLLIYNDTKLIIFSKTGNKIFETEVESKISKKNAIMNKRGSCIISTEEEPYLLSVYTISGAKRINLKLDDSPCGVDISQDDTYAIYFNESFVGNTLKYVMKLLDLKTGKQIWERTLPIYTEEIPEIYLANNYIILYFNDKDQHIVYLYDFKGNLTKQYNYPQKPIFSQDKKYILIFDASKIYLYEIKT